MQEQFKVIQKAYHLSREIISSAEGKPWVVDLAWETAVYEHLQVAKSNAPFD